MLHDYIYSLTLRDSGFIPRIMLHDVELRFYISTYPESNPREDSGGSEMLPIFGNTVSGPLQCSLWILFLIN